MKKFFVFMSSDLVQREFWDLQNDERAVLVDNSIIKVKSFFLRILQKVHLSHKINKIIDLPFKYVWSNAYGKINLDPKDENYFLLPNGEIFPFTPKILNKYSKKYNVKLILFLGDHISSPAANYAKYCMKKVHFDKIITINLKDAQKYGFLYHELPYSVFPGKLDAVTINDVFFIGRKKERFDVLENAYAYMKKNNVKIKCMVADVPKNEQIDNGMVYIEPIPYEKSLENTLQSNCILEIPTPGQTGATLRYYEAICYNKKLLTYDKNVINKKFYNPQYIRVFEKPEDIDCNWIKERTPVDYHYDGSFSPSKLLDYIDTL